MLLLGLHGKGAFPFCWKKYKFSVVEKDAGIQIKMENNNIYLSFDLLQKIY